MSSFRTTIDSVSRVYSAQELIRRVVFVVGGSMVLALSARIQVPMWPVPVTLQDFAVLLLGAGLGSGLGTLAVAAYLAQGAMGLPVFAQPPYGGIGYFVGPTAGYLWGFVLAAAVIGYLADHGWTRRWPSALVTMVVGQLLIYLAGFSWMAVLMGVVPAFVSGIQPFWMGGVVKVIVASVIVGCGLLPGTVAGSVSKRT